MIQKLVIGIACALFIVNTVMVGKTAQLTKDAGAMEKSIQGMNDEILDIESKLVSDKTLSNYYDQAKSFNLTKKGDILYVDPVTYALR